MNYGSRIPSRGGMPPQPFMNPMQGRPPMMPNLPMMGGGFRPPGGPFPMRPNSPMMGGGFRPPGRPSPMRPNSPMMGGGFRPPGRPSPMRPNSPMMGGGFRPPGGPSQMMPNSPMMGGGFRPPGGPSQMRPNSPMTGGEFRPPGGPSQMMPNSPMMGGGSRPPGGPSQMRSGRGGGLLAKLFGRGNQSLGMAAGPMQTASRAMGSGAANTGGGILKSLSNPAAINGFLTNSQKVLSTAQQFGPMFQQYGPIVKNIPSMWKAFRGLTSSTDKSAGDNVRKNNNSSIKTTKEKKNEIPIEKLPIQNVKKEKKGQSKPKIFF
ncbi:hypothetical protein KHA94_14115 [Bacillus sp. FJAT-49705]|uniref:YqfQ-like protein n=1 Tax=Cytobacillus citreus TaxID=2833586 RepID=A0ABS5NU11_9BACI|nr:VrrA/YqfQ family protein [Cytobacillus citreus]MBS4191321.1 hypothetical protein [Cytobacillus citreus]